MREKLERVVSLYRERRLNSQDELDLRLLSGELSEAVHQLSVFLLQNKKTDRFDEACEKMKEIFRYVEPREAFSSSAEEYRFHRSPIASSFIYCAYEGESSKEIHDKLSSDLEKIQQAGNIEEEGIRKLVDSYRTTFWKIIEGCISVLEEPRERVVY